jgi:hypothetical protein
MVWIAAVNDCKADPECVGEIEDISTIYNWLINQLWNFSPEFDEKTKYK